MSEIGTIKQREITDEMRESYLDYAMSVIVSRALPDVRDGLKPVHRRVLFAMNEMGLRHTAKFVKSARIVGEVLGKYHPHGDVAVYDTMVRMAQDFSLRYPLVKGQGNMGSIDGDNAAAMRYCVTGDTLIPTDEGLRRIDALGQENTNDIEINIKVLSKNRQIHTANRWFDSGTHSALTIITQRGHALSGSYNHPILVWNKNIITRQPEFRWKLLQDIKIGDIAVIDRSPDLLWPKEKVSLAAYIPHPQNPRTKIKKLPKELNEDLAYILGALVAEGTIKQNEIEFCNSDKEWIDDFTKRWMRAFPDCRLHHFARKPNSFGRKPYFTIEIHSRYIIEFLRNIGLAPVKSGQKTIPHCILRSPKSVVASFLRAYFEGDGSISQSGKMTELSAISKSETLVSQLQIVLLRFGIAGAKRFDAYRSTHKLYLRGLKNYKIFQHEIGFISSCKKEKLTQAVCHISKDYSQTDFVPFLSEFVRSHDTSHGFARDFIAKHNFDRYGAMEERMGSVVAMMRTDAKTKTDVRAVFEQLLENKYLFDPIAEIRDAGFQRVYSVRVESDCHSFVGNGFINHNTEARMTSLAEELLRDIEKETVPFVDNYDATRKEPMVLPAAVPNLLLNGTVGIAVGMATNIPPHNLTEVCDALSHLIDHDDASNDDLLEFVKGPDFPTGGQIFNEKEIRQAYASGKGAILTRATAEIVENKKGHPQILITEIPYQVNKSELIEKMADLVREKKIEGIKDIRDESDKDGLTIAIDLKDSAYPQKVLNSLYKYTDLEKTFHMHMLALVDGLQPETMPLKRVLAEYLKHRIVVVTRRTQFDLARAKERAHILEGLKKALDHIDAVIQTIKKSRDRDEAHKNLIAKFKFSEAQANAILEMRLQTLAGLERQKIDDELKEKLALIKELEALLKDSRKIRAVIKKEISELKEKYGDERRTKVVKYAAREIAEEDLIPEEETIIALTQGGYIKRIKPDQYRVQRRGGKGIIGMETKEEDVVTHFITANTHSQLLFFSSIGKVYQTRAYEVPEGSRVSKGKAIQNFLPLGPGEAVTSVLAAPKSEKKKGEMEGGSRYLVMVTEHGIIKKVDGLAFESVRQSGLIAIKLKKGDVLRWVKITSGKDDIALVTRRGQAIRFPEKDVRPMGRGAAGVKAMRLKKDDMLVGADIVTPAASQLLVVMEQGYGKRTPMKEYKRQRRGGSGIKTAKVTAKNGAVVSARVLREGESELVAISRKGQVIRTALSSVAVSGRATQGVRIMKLAEGDKLASITTL